MESRAAPKSPGLRRGNGAGGIQTRGINCMSLMRLLTSGKTLVGLQDARPHYRMADSRSMPKFGSTKNPIRGSQKAATVQMEARVLVEKPEGRHLKEAPNPKLQAPDKSQTPNLKLHGSDFGVRK